MSGALFDIKLLEGALRWFEDCAFINTLGKEGRADPSMRDSTASRIMGIGDEFRGQLLRAASKKEASFDQRFVFESDASAAWVGGAIYRWNAQSRRAFSVNDELRTMLEATKFKSVTWSDVPWPFDSFLLLLETPVALNSEHMPEYLIGGVLFTKGSPVQVQKLLDEETGGEFGAGVMLLPTGLENYECLTEKQKLRFTRAVRKRDLTTLDEGISRFERQVNKVGVTPFWTGLGGRDWGTDSIMNKQHEIKCLGAMPDVASSLGTRIVDMIRLVAAFSFYLSTIPVGTQERTAHVRPGSLPPAIARNDPRLVSLKSNVCRVTSSFTLTPGEKEAIEDAMARERTGEIVPHWRRGHFRRPPGLGINPEAKRTVWVQPCFVNRRHLPEGVLPGGALVRVGAPDTDASLEMV